MGLDFLRAKEEQFVQQRDKSKLEELDTAELHSRATPDVSIQQFRCILAENAILKPGLELIGRATSESEIRILQRGKDIGYMHPDDAIELNGHMKRNRRYLGVISLIITEAPNIDGEFLVIPKKPFKR